MKLPYNTPVKVVHCPVGAYQGATGKVKCIDRDNITPILVHFDFPVTDGHSHQEDMWFRFCEVEVI
jgi:hypothetical protein